MLQYWAIRHIPSGNILATSQSTQHGNGNTRVEVADVGVPRLFQTKDTAVRAMNAWLLGPHHCSYEDGIEIYNAKVPRKREDMEIVEIHLEVK